MKYTLELDEEERLCVLAALNTYRTSRFMASLPHSVLDALLDRLEDAVPE